MTLVIECVRAGLRACDCFDSAERVWSQLLGLALTHGWLPRGTTNWHTPQGETMDYSAPDWLHAKRHRGPMPARSQRPSAQYLQAMPFGQSSRSSPCTAMAADSFLLVTKLIAARQPSHCEKLRRVTNRVHARTRVPDSCWRGTHPPPISLRETRPFSLVAVAGANNLIYLQFRRQPVFELIPRNPPPRLGAKIGCVRDHIVSQACRDEPDRYRNERCRSR